MIIALASSKGGVGKSTAAAAIAGAFAHTGLKVHIIDLDSNLTVSRWLGDGKVSRGLSVSAADPQDLTAHLAQLAKTLKPDVTLIDVAGTYERALTVAVARAHLTIIPAGPAEADIFEAARVARHIKSVFQAFNRNPVYRVLMTRVMPLASHAQVHACGEVDKLKLPCFRTALQHRAAYIEIGLSGLPPHYANSRRGTVGKAVSEVDALIEEICELTGFKGAYRRKGAA